MSAQPDAPVEWLTAEAHERLVAELAERKTTRRDDLSHKIEVARAHGDLRENAEYHAAKDEQGQNEADIRKLEAKLRRAQVGTPPPSDTVAAGMVLVTEHADGDADEFLLGSREEEPESLAVVSAGSPLGQALLGAKVGDTVTYQAPRGELRVTIRSATPYTG